MDQRDHFRRVRKAYEQIADQLRESILTGSLTPGSRLPSEHELAQLFGVSRTTVREALRLLAAERLVRTVRGTKGGSFVSRPTAEHISGTLSVNLTLLMQDDAVKLDDFLEARATLEVPVARLAAERRVETDLERLRESIPDDVTRPTQEQFVLNRGFHEVLSHSCGNTLLQIAIKPIFVVLQTHLARSSLTAADHRLIREAHVRLLDVVAKGDPDAAEREMQRHLEELAPLYHRAWSL